MWHILWMLLASSLHGQVEKRMKKKLHNSYHSLSTQICWPTDSHFSNELLKSYEPWQRFVVHLRIFVRSLKKLKKRRDLCQEMKTQINFGMSLTANCCTRKCHSRLDSPTLQLGYVVLELWVVQVFVSLSQLHHDTNFSSYQVQDKWNRL